MSIKLVIVDDAPFIREVLKHIFQGTEIKVVGEAKDGEEAVELALKAKPDAILMDIVMPRRSGIDATLDILKHLPETKIIACSTVDQNTMVLRALDAGCCDYVIKPFKAVEVIKVIRKAFKNDKDKEPQP